MDDTGNKTPPRRPLWVARLCALVVAVMSVGALIAAPASAARQGETVVTPNASQVLFDPVTSATFTMGNQPAGDYTVAITGCSRCPSPVTYDQTFTFTYDPVAGTTTTVAFPSPVSAPGGYTLVLRQGVGYYELARSTFSIMRPEPPTADVVVNEYEFYPYRRDGYLDAVHVEWQASSMTPGFSTLSVVDAAGKAVYSRQVISYGTWRWTGRTDDGDMAPVGKYKIRLTVTDGRGQTAVSEGRVQLKHGKTWAPATAKKKGNQTSSRRAGPGCQTVPGSGVLHMDCTNGTSAEALYTFRVPRKIRDVHVTVRGTKDRGTRGDIEFTYVRPSARTLVARIRITGSRAYIANEVTLTYRGYTMR